MRSIGFRIRSGFGFFAKQPHDGSFPPLLFDWGHAMNRAAIGGGGEA